MRLEALEEEERAYLPAGAPTLRSLPSSMLEESVATLICGRPVCVTADTPVAEVIARMKQEHIGCLLVTADEKLVGIFTERDVLCRVVSRDDDVRSAPVSDFMTRAPSALPMDATVAHALREMSVGGFHHVPLVDLEGRPERIVSDKDIVDFMVDVFSVEVMTLPPNPFRDATLSREGA